MLGRINQLRQMSVADLQAEWQRLYGAPARSNNRDHLFRRLAYRVQELAHCSLSDQARARLEELGQDAFDLAASRHQGAHDTDPAAPATTEPKVTRIRDPRRVLPGTVLTHPYHGQEIRVVALDEDQFEYDGQVYSSLSAVARAVTGQKWNGRLFFGLTKRKR
jgi:hypothetical protein